MIYSQRSVPIQPKTSEILQKFAKNWQRRRPRPRRAGHEGRGGAAEPGQQDGEPEEVDAAGDLGARKKASGRSKCTM